MATDISQLDMFQVVPDPFIGIQVRGITRQLLHLQPSSSAMCQESLDCLVPMDRCSIPDHQHLAIDVPQQVSKEAYHIYSLESPLLHRHQQVARLGYPADCRQMIPRKWYVQDR